MNTKTVQEGSITVTYKVREVNRLGGIWYDWVTDSGDESDSFFPTIREAIKDVETQYQ